MILSTSDTIEGREIVETIGIVRGNAARARGIGYDITAGIRNIFGGAVPEYSNLMTQSRDEATQMMIESAEAAGADAIVAVRYTTSMIATGVSEILAFGTAVRLR
ncbi:MAG: YbjQ family protein [Chloroflexota bacterium]|jgi:uncharacterized protein YbjQ (UPF0145 family)